MSDNQCGYRDMAFPHYTQLDTTDCGSTSLRIIAAFYGRKFSAQHLRDICHTSREGVSMLSISDAAESIGFRTSGVKLNWEQLRNLKALPCIVHWNQQHFAVVYKIEKHRSGWRVRVADPARGRLVYDEAAFRKSWEVEDPDSRGRFGLALLLEPTPAFYEKKNDDPHRLGFGFLLKYIKPYYKYLSQLLLALLTGSIISLILPFLTQSVVDTGIGNHDLNFVVVILVAQVMLVLGQMANSLIRSRLMLHITARIGISLISDFLSKLMRLPIAFFDTKMVGDIMQRIGDLNRIQNFLTGMLLSIVTAVITFVIYGIVMAGYSLGILTVFLAGSVAYVGWILLFLKRRRKLDYMRFQESAANQGNIVQLINGMQDIKLNNCEKQKRWEWERIQAQLYKISIKGLSLSQTQQVGGLFIDQTKNVLISFISAKAVIDGDMTLGMMMAIQYIIGQLNGPVSQFIDFVQAAQDARISLERLNEIHAKEDEEPTGTEKIRKIPEAAPIEFSHVVFQYEGPNSEKVLNDINLTIEPGKVTAIVGGSGSGKTTLLKLILGFYQPVCGSIRLGGIPLHEYSDRVWRSLCGTVMQDGFIFSDTIAGNVGLIDQSPEAEKVSHALQVANITDFIGTLPLGVNTKIGPDGHGLSSGQKQRLLIARAVYKNAPYLIFDEATNSLDAKNERIIMENLSRFFANKTVVVVAHRLSTVRNADKIIVLDHGRVVEQGTHLQLVRREGYYYDLVRNQLELGS